MSDLVLPLSRDQILARVVALEQTQLAASAPSQGAITGPLGIRIFTASAPSQILGAIPDNPRRTQTAFTY